MIKYDSLHEALYECFKDYMGTDHEYLLYEEKHVHKEFKKFVGVKEYKKYEGYDDKLWRESWRLFERMTFKHY